MKRSSMLLLMSAWAWSSAHAMTLEDAIGAALNNENQLKISGLNVNQAEAMLQQAKKRNGVNLNLAGQISIEKIDSSDASNPFFETDGVRRPRALELQFDYPIYTSGRKRLGIEVAKMQLQARSQAFSGQRASTILQTVQVYTDVLKQQALLALKNQVRSNLEKSLSDAQKRFNSGVVTRADLALVQSQFAQGQADVVLAQSNLDISVAQFVQVTGVSPEQLQTVRQVPFVPSNLDQVLEYVSKHPLIQQAKFEQQAAEKQYKLTKRELTPTVNVTSRVSAQHEISNFDSSSDNYMVGLQLNVPLFDQGLNRANRQKAQVDVSLAQEKIQATQQNLSQQAQATYAQLQAVQQNKQALNNAIDAAALAFNYIQKELEFGTKTTFDALNAEQTLQDLQTQKLLNEQDEVVLVYQLLDQMGQLNNNTTTPSLVSTRTHSALTDTSDAANMHTTAQDATPKSTTPNIVAQRAATSATAPKVLNSKNAKSAQIPSVRKISSKNTLSKEASAQPQQAADSQVNVAQPTVTQLPLSSHETAVIASALPLNTQSGISSSPAASSNKVSITRSILQPSTWFARPAAASTPTSVNTVVLLNTVTPQRPLLAEATLQPPMATSTNALFNVQHELTALPQSTTVLSQSAQKRSIFKPSSWWQKPHRANAIAPAPYRPLITERK